LKFQNLMFYILIERDMNFHKKIRQMILSYIILLNMKVLKKLSSFLRFNESYKIAQNIDEILKMMSEYIKF